MKKIWLIVCVCIVSGIVFFWMRPFTSDAELITRWNQNQPAFTELLTFIKSGVESPRRQMLMRELGIFSAGGNQYVGYTFTAYASGSMLGGIDKGYVYLEKKPASAETNLDSIKGRKAVTTYYRHIEGNWYIFLLWDD